MNAVVQGVMNVGASLGAIIGPLSIGALTERDPHAGWRNFYASHPPQNH